MYSPPKAIKTAVTRATAFSEFLTASDIAIYEHARPVKIRVTPKATIIKGCIISMNGTTKNKKGIPIK
tara:strand:- start:9 stop:212 length:204 start_codon:yes stop_codon:yes gene_type:complete